MGIDPLFVVVALLFLQALLQWALAFAFVVLVKKYLGKSIKKGVGNIGKSIKDRVSEVQRTVAGGDPEQNEECGVE